MVKNIVLLVGVAYVIAIAITGTIRPVQAEDECEQHTLVVERLPIVGLVCIFEPTPYQFPF